MRYELFPFIRECQEVILKEICHREQGVTMGAQTLRCLGCRDANRGVEIKANRWVCHQLGAWGTRGMEEGRLIGAPIAGRLTKGCHKSWIICEIKAS